MANYAVSAHQLTEGGTVLVRGTLGYSRLTRLIDGEDLVRSNQRKIAAGMNPVTKPHTTVTVAQAEVLYADPAAPTIDERFVAERCYLSPKHPDKGPQYSIDSKGQTLPIIAIPDGAGTYTQDTSGRELAADLTVSLVLRVYKPQNFANCGLALDQVIVHEPVKYYGGGVNTAELAARGIVFSTPPRAIRAADATPAGQVPPVPADGAVPGSAVPGLEAAPALVLPEPMADAPVPTAIPAVTGAGPAPEPRAGETPEQKLARLEAENAALRGGGSAFGDPVGAGVGSPWDQGGHPVTGGIAYEG
ncbi:hypothetical protein [Granulicoccus phenolivorans]|uniref:hypothetical protein n=1 Tax=Granulicoccus phenolivorans TaxID=266854 RepID=UPI0004200583|nr:hypothetical protein [Granulicoccus phenolivorans]